MFGNPYCEADVLNTVILLQPVQQLWLYVSDREIFLNYAHFGFSFLADGYLLCPELKLGQM